MFHYSANIHQWIKGWGIDEVKESLILPILVIEVKYLFMILVEADPTDSQTQCCEFISHVV